MANHSIYCKGFFFFLVVVVVRGLSALGGLWDLSPCEKWSRVLLCDPMDCSLPGSSVHGVFQARIVEWVAISFSRGSSLARDQTRVSCIVGRCFYHLSHQGSPPSWSPYLVFHRQHPSPHQVQMLFSSIFFLCFIFIHALNKYLKSAHNVPNWCRTLGYGSEQNRPKF